MKKKVLFVCLGNICRSPLAEAIFKHKITEMKLENEWEADSCGTSNYHIDQTPDPRTIKNAQQNGVLIDHRGRQLTRRDLEMYDHVLVMDQSNYQNTVRLAEPHLQSKIQLMRAYDTMGTNRDVPDPYYGSEQDFQEVFEILDRSIAHFIQQAQQNS